MDELHESGSDERNLEDQATRDIVIQLATSFRESRRTLNSLINKVEHLLNDKTQEMIERVRKDDDRDHKIKVLEDWKLELDRATLPNRVTNVENTINLAGEAGKRAAGLSREFLKRLIDLVAYFMVGAATYLWVYRIEIWTWIFTKAKVP